MFSNAWDWIKEHKVAIVATTATVAAAAAAYAYKEELTGLLTTVGEGDSQQSQIKL